jgi:hypothetical protein
VAELVRLAQILSLERQRRRTTDFYRENGGQKVRASSERMPNGGSWRATSKARSWARDRRCPSSSRAPRIRGLRRLPAGRRSLILATSGWWRAAVPSSSASRSLLAARDTNPCVRRTFRRLTGGRDSEVWELRLFHLFRITDVRWRAACLRIG